MPDVYVGVEGEDGNVSYVPLAEAENVDEVIASLPEEIVQKHSEFSRVQSLYQKAVDESKKFKTRAQTAEAQLSAKSKSNSGEEDEDTTPDDTEETPKNTNKQTPNVPTINEEDLIAKVRQQVLDDIASAQEALRSEEAKLNNLIKKHRLQEVDGIQDMLKDAKDPEALAERLGRTLRHYDIIHDGEAEVGSDDFNLRIRENLGLPNKK